MFKIATIFLSLFTIALGNKCDNVTCPKVPKHYEELGCKPIILQGQCCAQSYDCTEFHGRDLSKCYHKGKTYEDRQEIHDPELESSCTVACRCIRDDPEEAARVVCAHIDCPEFFGEERRENQTCISQYKPGKCCKERDVCDDDLKSLKTCKFQGKTYYEGEQVDADEACYSCYCGQGFEDKPAHLNKHCRKINCNIDIHYSEKIHDGCVPMYYKTEDCCPIGSRCPDDSTTVIKAKNSVAPPNSPQCTFGKLKLSIGDNLSPEYEEDTCKVCTCKTPPFVTCVQVC